MRFKAACIQMNAGDDVEDNIAKATLFINKAAKAGADLITLPENCAVMVSSVGKFGRGRLIEAGERFIQAMEFLAAKNGCWILIGAIKVSAGKSDKFYNRSVLIDDKGKVAARYDKVHLFDVRLPNGESHMESSKCERGSKAVVTKTPWGRLGMTICYDLRFPYLFRKLADKGADFITVPAAFTYYTGKAHWHVLLRARAIENGCYIIAPAQVGDHPGGRRTFGHSLIVDPWGEVLADAGTKEGFIISQIDTDKVINTRLAIPSLKHTRNPK